MMMTLLWHIYDDVANDVIDDVACDVTNDVADSSPFYDWANQLGFFFDSIKSKPTKQAH